MSQQNYQNRKLRDQSSVVAIAPAVVSDERKPLAFERQLAAAQQTATYAPSRLATLYARCLQSIQQLRQRLLKPRGRRKLDLLEIQQLGDKRFIAIIRVDKQRFLIAGAAGSVSLLAEFTPQRAATKRTSRKDGA
jgi:hypothetical protein